MDKKLVFGYKEGDKVVYLTLAKKRINVPPFGPLTADEVMQREDVLRHLVASRSVFPVLRELTAEEVAEYVKVEKTPEELAQEAAKKAAKATKKANEAKAAKDLKDAQDAKAAQDAKTAQELKDAADAKAAEDAKLALEAAQAEYEQVTGNKPGNMKLETLQKKIEEVKSKPKSE